MLSKLAIPVAVRGKATGTELLVEAEFRVGGGLDHRSLARGLRVSFLTRKAARSGGVCPKDSKSMRPACVGVALTIRTAAVSFRRFTPGSEA